MYKRWKTGGWREEKTERDQTNPPSSPCRSFVLVLSCLHPFLAILLRLCHCLALHHSLALFSFPYFFLLPLDLPLSVNNSIHLFLPIPFIQKLSLSLPAYLPLLYFTPSLLLFIPCLSPPFFFNTLLSHYLTPSIVVVVDYAIGAEDTSFLSTRFSAQSDYTKPLSAVSFFSLFLAQTQIQGFPNVQVIDMGSTCVLVTHLYSNALMSWNSTCIYHCPQNPRMKHMCTDKHTWTWRSLRISFFLCLSLGDPPGQHTALDVPELE